MVAHAQKIACIKKGETIQRIQHGLLKCFKRENKSGIHQSSTIRWSVHLKTQADVYNAILFWNISFMKASYLYITCNNNNFKESCITCQTNSKASCSMQIKTCHFYWIVLYSNFILCKTFIFHEILHKCITFWSD